MKGPRLEHLSCAPISRPSDPAAVESPASLAQCRESPTAADASETSWSRTGPRTCQLECPGASVVQLGCVALVGQHPPSECRLAAVPLEQAVLPRDAKCGRRRRR